MQSQAFRHIAAQLNNGLPAELMIELGDGKRAVRRFVPRDRLILLGGGHVSLAVASIAAMTGFSVTVVDDRPDFANHTRFSMADTVLCDSFAHAIRTLDIRSGDYVCVLTRGHRWDKECVETVLSGTTPRYLGMIGSHRRVEGLNEQLLEQGFDGALIGQMHAPIGLSIGAVTPAEIGVSILAELIDCRSKLPQSEKIEGLLEQTNSDPSLLDFLVHDPHPRAVLTVLSATGSTPVRSGAMMAVNAVGQAAGTIGGGCSEAAALNRARRVIGTGGSEIYEADMTNVVAAEDGMVCGGVMRVLIEDVTD